MKITELLEGFDKEPTRLPPDELRALAHPTASNIAGRYRAGKVAFDNERGLGAVPNNSNVDYRGFVAMMSPSEYLELAAPADRSGDAKRLAGFLNSGVAIGTPYLNIEVNFKEYKAGKPLKVKVTGHDGRGRMTAIKTVQGDEPVPVHFFLDGGLRARDLDHDFFRDMKKYGIAPQGKAQPKSAELGKIFWNNQTI